jgi:hypothetical protein
MHHRPVGILSFAAVLFVAGLVAGGCGAARVAPTAEVPTSEPSSAPRAEQQPTATPTQPPTQESEPTTAPTQVPPSATPDPEPTAAPTQAAPSATPDPEPATPDPQPTTPIQADAATLLQERCTACHALDRVAEKSESLQEWGQIVAEMIGRGAVLNDAEAAQLIAYLAQMYGE